MKLKNFGLALLGIAVMGMISPQYADASNMDIEGTVSMKSSEEVKEDEGHKGRLSLAPATHHKFDKKEIRSLLEKGHSKENVFQAAQIAKLSEKSIEEVLNHYNRSKSWEKTAEHYGVSPEKLAEQKARWKAHKKKFQQHKGEILSYVADYSNKDVTELKGYLKQDIRMPQLVKAAIVAKLSNKDLKEVINYKKAGHSREEMMKHFNVSDAQMHAEMLKVWSDIKSIMKK
ncbi:hypothetical protein [Alkalihalobacillus sp. TS-13]|uniref:hypothetical protein n=1 Tax=Alkalihalobacillus sp. TS-13 TaxID=2842455 RepID=UPI001C88C3BE|nr:hypothetical protein [Alkalihalobacillus sp. TS-13]